MPASGEIEEMPCGLPPSVALGCGSICIVTFICAAIGFSPAAQRFIAEQDAKQQQLKTLPPCSANVLLAAPALQTELQAFPQKMRLLGDSLNRSSSAAAGDLVERVVSQVGTMVRVSEKARKLLRCDGGAARLGGVDATQFEQTHRALRRLHALARRKQAERGGRGPFGRARAGASTPSPHIEQSVTRQVR